MPRYENKFVQEINEKDIGVAFRLKQAKFSGQFGDILFLSPDYKNCVLEGKKISGEPESPDDSSYNTFYFQKKEQEQYNDLQEFATQSGCEPFYFFYVTFGRGRKANFYVIPQSDVVPDKISLKEIKQKSVNKFYESTRANN